MKIIYKGLNIADNFLQARKMKVEQVIDQLNNINELQFTNTHSKQNYFDIISAIFRAAQPGGEHKKLASVLKSLFINKDNEEKIIELGGTKLDLYIMNDDFEHVQKVNDIIGAKDNYSLAKYYRMLDIAEYAYKEEGLEFKSKDTTITLNFINMSYAIPIWGIPYCELYEKNIEENPKTLAVMIHDSGQGSWGYYQASYEDTISDVFDAVIRYGNGGNYISIPHIPKLLEKILDSHQNLDFVMVRISMHDLEGSKAALKDIIQLLPDNLAKQTLYVVDSCHAGQYHAQWAEYCKESILITSSNGHETTSVLDCRPERFLNSVKKNGLNIESFLDFFSSYRKSTPYITGKFTEGDNNSKEIYKIGHDVENYSIKKLYRDISEQHRINNETDEDRAEKAKFKADMKKWLESITNHENNDSNLTHDTILSEQNLPIETSNSSDTTIVCNGTLTEELDLF